MALDPAAVREAVGYSSARGAQSVRVYRHDCLVATSGNDALTGSTPMATWSMTKGVVSMLVGRAVTQGALSVDDPIGLHLDGLGPAHGAITVRQLLTQTSGLRFAWVNDLNAAGTGDSVAATLRRPFEHPPGTRFMYAQTTVTVLVAVVEAAVGEDLQTYAARELFAPIGIPDAHWRWDRDGSGRTQGFAFLDMSPEGFARLGSLLLAEGRWRGSELIGASYIREGRRGTGPNPSYGFLWRTNEGERHPFFGYVDDDWLERRWLPPAPPDAFGLTGLFDQRLVVVPSLGLVVLRMGLPEDLFADPIGQVRGREPSGHHRFVEQLLDGVDRCGARPRALGAGPRCRLARPRSPGRRRLLTVDSPAGPPPRHLVGFWSILDRFVARCGPGPDGADVWWGSGRSSTDSSPDVGDLQAGVGSGGGAGRAEEGLQPAQQVGGVVEVLPAGVEHRPAERRQQVVARAGPADRGADPSATARSRPRARPRRAPTPHRPGRRSGRRSGSAPGARVRGARGW